MTDNLSREDRSRCMSRIRSRGMAPEMAVRSLVHRMGYRFRLHGKGLPGKPDLVLPRWRAVIFVNGCFWHWHDDEDCRIAGLPKSNRDYWIPKLRRTRERDRQQRTRLEADGWRVLTVWECQLADSGRVAERIAGFLEPSERHAEAEGRPARRMAS